jgi:hypothetical protein
VFLFSFSLLSGACPGCEEEVFSCEVYRSCYGDEHVASCSEILFLRCFE